MAGNKYEAMPIVGPFMDAGVSPVRMQPGFLSEVIGADGRFLGCIRPFPGMNRLVNLNDITGVTSPTNLSYMEYAEVQRGTSGTDKLRGFVVRYGTITNQQVRFCYYDTSTSAWASQAIYAAGGSPLITKTTTMSCTTNGQFLYVAADGRTPQVLWHNGTSWVAGDMGPVFTSLAVPVVGDSDTTGYMDAAGTYHVGYRLYSSTRRVRSPMSEVARHTTAAGKTAVKVTIQMSALQSGGSFLGDTYDTLEYYRTISTPVAGSAFAGGYLYQETTRDLTTVSGTGNSSTDDLDITGIGVYAEVDDIITFDGIDYTVTAIEDDNTLSVTPDPTAKSNKAWVFKTFVQVLGATLDDFRLTQTLVRYDPWVDETGVPVSSGTIARYAGMTFMGDRNRGIRWSPTHKNSPEDFPADNWSRQRQEDGPIIQFVEAGDSLYGFTRSCVYRITKAGAYLNIRRMHVGRGSTSKGGAHAVGKDVVFPSPLGIVSLDGATGNMEVLPSVERVIRDDWQAHLDHIVSGMDSYMGASFLYNTATVETIILWHTSRSISMLEQGVFTWICTGIHPVNGGSQRCFFSTADGILVYPDDDSTGTGTMLDVNGTVNGTETAGGSKSTLTDSAAAFNADCVGSYVMILTGYNVGATCRITARTATTLSVNFSYDIEKGARYIISPVIFRLRFPPLRSDAAWQPDVERKKVSGVTLLAHSHSGITSNGNASWKLSAYRDGSTSAQTAATEDMADGLIVFTYNDTAHLLELVLEAWLAGVSFELIGLQAKKPTTYSRSDS